jgi:sterol 3beta-glucosyltransferase
VVQGAPHPLVLPRAAAAVHHGGIGTVQAATAAGTPSVLVPFIAEQAAEGYRPRVAEVATAMATEGGTLSARRVLTTLS